MNTKTIIPLMALGLFLYSCGPSKGDRAAVCNCEELNTKMKNLEGEYQISDNMSSSEAEKKVKAQNQEAYNKCVKLNKDLGDDVYLKAAQDCKAK
jgi:hypothetical protein